MDADFNSVQMSGATRVATLLLALGEECAGALLARMQDSPSELSRIGLQLRDCGDVSGGQCEEAISSLLEELSRGHVAGPSSERFIAAALGRALPADKAQQMRALVGITEVPAEVLALNWQSPEQVATRLEGLRPQARAATLALLEPPHGSHVLSCFTDYDAVDCLVRICALKPVNPEILTNALHDRALSVTQCAPIRINGPSVAAKLLLGLAPQTRATLLVVLEQHEPGFVGLVQEYLFSFADLATMGAAEMQLLLREVSMETVVMALYEAPAAVVANVTNNLSTRAKAALREDIEALGVVSPAEMAHGRDEFLSSARKLLLAG